MCTIKKIVPLIALLATMNTAAEESATAMGSASALILSQPFSMSAPQWPDSSSELDSGGNLAEDIVFNTLQLPNSKLRKMLKKRAETRHIGFSFNGIPHSPLTVSLNDTYREMSLASELRLTTVRFSETDLRSGYMDEDGKQSIFLDVLLSTKNSKNTLLNYFSLTIEHN